MSGFGVAGAGSASRARLTWVKICGHRRPETALAAARAGAHAIGLIFAPSPRRVSLRDARAICAELPPEVERVGVFVDQEPAVVAETALAVGLTAVQLHGFESPEALAEIREEMARLLACGGNPGASGGRGPVEVYKAIRVRDRGRLAQLGPYLRTGGQTSLTAASVPAASPPAASPPETSPLPRYLLDAFVPGLAGGAGRTFDWELARAASAEFPGRMILAGGLNPGNVAGAIAWVRPWGLDVSSGVETGGEKDPELMAAFLRAVRAADLAVKEAESKEAAHVDG